VNKRNNNSEITKGIIPKESRVLVIIYAFVLAQIHNNNKNRYLRLTLKDN